MHGAPSGPRRHRNRKSFPAEAHCRLTVPPSLPRARLSDGRLCSDAELFEQAGRNGLKVRVSMDEREFPYRRCCGNEGVHGREAILTGLANLPSPCGGMCCQGLDENDF